MPDLLPEVSWVLLSSSSFKGVVTATFFDLPDVPMVAAAMMSWAAARESPASADVVGLLSKSSQEPFESAFLPAWFYLPLLLRLPCLFIRIFLKFKLHF